MWEGSYLYTSVNKAQGGTEHMDESNVFKTGLIGGIFQQNISWVTLIFAIFSKFSRINVWRFIWYVNRPDSWYSTGFCWRCPVCTDRGTVQFHYSENLMDKLLIFGASLLFPLCTTVQNGGIGLSGKYKGWKEIWPQIYYWMKNCSIGFGLILISWSCSLCNILQICGVEELFSDFYNYTKHLKSSQMNFEVYDSSA